VKSKSKKKIKVYRRRTRSIAHGSYGKKMDAVTDTLFEKEELSLPVLSTKGIPVQVEAYGGGKPVSIHLHGTTKPNYDSGTGTVVNLKASKAKGCKTKCPGSICINVSGVHVIKFKASPTITMPSRSEYSHLRPCQIKRVEKWMRKVLYPHEVAHKKAFETYNGIVRKPFKFKICKSEWSEALLQPYHNSIETTRRKAAQKKSDALDPFHTNIDLDCEDKPKSDKR